MKRFAKGLSILLIFLDVCSKKKNINRTMITRNHGYPEVI